MARSFEFEGIDLGVMLWRHYSWKLMLVFEFGAKPKQEARQKRQGRDYTKPWRKAFDICATEIESNCFGLM